MNKFVAGVRRLLASLKVFISSRTNRFAVFAVMCWWLLAFVYQPWLPWYRVDRTSSLSIGARHLWMASIEVDAFVDAYVVSPRRRAFLKSGVGHTSIVVDPSELQPLTPDFFMATQQKAISNYYQDHVPFCLTESSFLVWGFVVASSICLRDRRRGLW